MPVNLELKIKVDFVKKIERLLHTKKVLFVGILKQKDIYYEYKNGLLKMRLEDGSACLIKYLRDEKGKRWSNYKIVNINGSEPEKYFADILKVESIVEKERKLYKYKNTRIHVDTVKSLGYFLELETLVTSGKKQAEKEFAEVVELLQLDLSKQIKSSYRNLINR